MFPITTTLLEWFSYFARCSAKVSAVQEQSEIRAVMALRYTWVVLRLPLMYNDSLLDSAVS